MTSDIQNKDQRVRLADKSMKSQLESQTDMHRKVEDYLRREFSVLPILGGVYGYHKSLKWSVITYSLKITMYTAVSLTGMDLLYSSYILRNSMSMFTVAFHCFLICCVVMTGSVSLTLQRQRVFDYLVNLEFSENWAEYQDSQFYRSLEGQSRRRIVRLMVLFVSGYGACVLIGVTFPFVDMYMGNDEQVTNVTGIYWKGLPFAMWWPFDAHSSLLTWISCFMCQGLWATFALNMCTSAIILCFFACEKLLNHMKLLIHAIEHLDQRARAKFKKEQKQVPTVNFEEEYEDCYYDCIIQNVKHHHKIVKGLAEFMKLANYAIAVPFFGGALLLGLAGLNLLSHDDARIGPKIFCASLGITEATNMFLMCSYGEKFEHESEELFNSIIYTKWYNRSMKCRKALMILQCGTVRLVKITAAKMIVLNMATFANLVNSAYSIFNLNSVASSAD